MRGLIVGFRRTLKVPSSPEGHTIVIRMLSGIELEEAAAKQLKRTIEWAADLAKVREATTAAAEVVAAKAARPAPTAEELRTEDLGSYDRDILLGYGVISWSFTNEDGSVVPLDVKLFDAPTREWAAGEVLRFSKPTDDDLGKA